MNFMSFKACKVSGGDGEIRTLAPGLIRPNPLAGDPLIAAWVRLHI